jgi:hypothetical protein
MFNWFDRLLVKVAKKILNKYAPKGEFIAYINKKEEEILKALGAYLFNIFFAALTIRDIRWGRE